MRVCKLAAHSLGLQVYGTFQKTPFPLDYDKLDAAAKAKLPVGNYNYVAGSAGSEATARANRAAFDDYQIVPSMLRDANKRDLSVTLFGEKHVAPVLLAPVGVQSIMHPDGELATARAAQELELGMILSTAATRSLEKVAEANGNGKRWYQLYW
jgi:isopentenyl diphosphate isomerase/L-lactate dehydrogenase-like FMN-dependent dehydrogenase